MTRLTWAAIAALLLFGGIHSGQHRLGLISSAQAADPTDFDQGFNAAETAQPGTRGARIGGSLSEPWVTVSNAPTAVSRSAAAVVDGLLYVIGGEGTSAQRLGLVQIYDPATGTWNSASAPTMPTPASNICAVAIGTEIFIPGGFNGTSRIADLQVFDTVANTWSTVETDPLPEGRLAPACAGFENRLYVFGGSTPAVADSATVWVYDPAAAAGTRWSSRADAPFEGAYGAALAVNGLIFYVGTGGPGLDNVRVDAYDPAANTWTAYPPLQTARSAAGIWARGTTLYVGGGGWASYLTSVEAYDTALGTSGSWTFTNTLNVGRRTFAYATDPESGALYAATGWAGAYLAQAETNAIAPSIASVTPSSGPPAGATTITLAGAYFQTGATVTVGGNGCTGVVVSNSTTLTCVTPAGVEGAADVVVQNPDGLTGTLTDGFVYVIGPVVSAIAPISGPSSGGTAVTLSGTGFQPGATASIGGNPCTDVNVSASTMLSCITPPGTAGAADVIVQNPDAQFSTLPAGFTYVPPPVVSSITPASGPTSGATAVTLAGSGFQPGATVTFAGNACLSPVVNSASSITCETPAGAVGAADIVVTNPDGQSGTLAAGFTYVAGPVITGVTPNTGPVSGGTSITLAGAGFQPGATVSVGGNPCISISVLNAATVTCTTPSGGMGAVDVVVTNPDSQSATLSGGFTYQALAMRPQVVPTLGVASMVALLLGMLLAGFVGLRRIGTG